MRTPRWRRGRQTSLTRETDQFHDNLQAGVQPAYFLTHAMDLYVRNEKGVLKAEPTNRYLLGLYEHGTFIRSMAIAPGSRITYIEPTVGNEAAKGLYYPGNAQQWPAIQQIIASHQPMLVGPINLVQGGRGIAYRVPVYLTQNDYWGIVSTVLDSDAFVTNAATSSGLTASTAALRTVNADGTSGEMIWGNPGVFTGNSVVANVQPLGASWQLAVATEPVDASIADPTKVAGLIISIALALLTYLLLRSRQRRVDAANSLAALSREAPGMLFQLKAKRDQTLEFTYVSDGVRDMFGLEPADVMRDSALLSSRVPTSALQTARVDLFAAADAGEPWHQRVQLRDGEGALRWYSVDATSEPVGSDTYVWHGLVSDITGEVERENQLKVSASVFESTHDGVVIMDPKGLTINVNPAFVTLTGFDLNDMLGHNPLDLLGSGLMTEAAFDDMTASLERHRFWRGEFIHRTKGGKVASRPVAVTSVTDDNGQLREYVAVFGSLNPLLDDIITGLPSRRVLEDRLSTLVDESHAPGQSVALIVLGIDRFRDVNEAHGHRFGDVVLKEIGERLRAAVPQPEVVARLSGDEFGIILAQPSDVAAIEKVAADVLRCFKDRFGAGDVQVYVTASIGISVYPNDTKTSFGLVTNAHQALRVAKEQGRDSSMYFTPKMQEEALARSQLTEDLRLAVERGELSMAFQPIVNLATGRVEKAEALIRWNHPIRGPIPPMEFIPTAEQAGLVKELGDFVFAETLAMARRTREIDPTFQLSLNMSPVEIADTHHLHANRLAIYDQSDVPGSAIVIEITEGVLLDRSPITATNLRLYRDAGMQFAVDDFGTGYSSLSYLQKLDVDYLKIDREFIMDLPEDEDSLSLCRAIIEMAHSLGLKVIGEGIETQAQCDVMAGLGCDYVQGFLYSRPVPADEFIAIVRGSSSH